MNTFDPMLVRPFINLIGAVSALIAAISWFRSATIRVPNNIDTMVDQLQRAGRWNAWAAGATCISALSQCLHFLFSSA